MRIVVRTDASVQIGSGHVIRCLALAEALRKAGAEVSFVSRNRPGELSAVTRSRGFHVVLLRTLKDDIDGLKGWLGRSEPEDAMETAEVLTSTGTPDWIVVDHYGMGEAWEGVFRDRGCRVAVIDDLANRRHDCDLLLDQTFGREPADYQSLVPADASLLVGSRYALLREEFGAARREMDAERSSAKKGIQILVNFGGSDPVNATGMVARLMQSWDPPPGIKPSLVFVVGRLYQHRRSLEEIVQGIRQPSVVRHDVEDLAELMVSSDLAIGAGGTTSWERCCLGLPTILVSIADNQRVIADNLHRAGAAFHVGEVQALKEDADQFLTALDRLLADEEARWAMRRSALQVTDGLGAQRAMDEITRLSQEVRR